MEAKLKTPTCSRCRIRKIRCDGQSTCHTCSAAGTSCEYNENEKDGRSLLELRKGAACLACRRKKKKCDGQVPCRTCASARKKVNCEYPDGIIATLPLLDKSPQDVLHAVILPPESISPHTSSTPSDISSTVPFSTSSGTSGSSDSSTGSPTYIPIPVVDIDNLPDIPLDISDIQSPSPFTIELSEAATYISLAELSHARDTFLDDTSKRGLSADVLQLQEDESMETESTPQRKRPADPLYPPFFQVPAPTPDSRDENELVQIRQLFLNHRIQLGLSVMDCVLQALSEGRSYRDLTDITLHPVLLHACQLMGYMLARHLQLHTWLLLPGQSDREAEQTRLTLASLQELGVAACPLAYLQTATLLSLYFFNKGDLVRSRSILARAGRLLLDHNLDTTMLEPQGPTEGKDTGFKATLTTKTAEAQAVLAQLVYLDVSYTIIMKLPSVLDPALHAMFKRLISAPNTNAEINFVRAKSAFLLLEAEQLAAQWYQPRLEANKAVEWQERYWVVMEALDTHRSFLMLTAKRIAFCPELHTMGLTLKVCTVMVLTGISVLLTLFTDAQPELFRTKREAILEIISISATFSEEDCEYLDPILSTCWTMIIGTLDYCISLGAQVTAQSMHDLPAMARVIRERNKTLQRVLPFAVDV